MNFEKLFSMQRELDERIEKEHPRMPGEERLAKRILALQVELGELANEWRGFKFWSNDQRPRDYCSFCRAIETPHKCKNPLLEEYVDCLHFILSIGLELNFDISEWLLEGNIYHSIMEQFLVINTFTSTFYKKPFEMIYVEMINVFIGLGEMLGFTWEQIEQAYISKNEVNHERQSTGY